MKNCPDENVLGAMLQGLLTEPEARALDAHIDRCSRCRGLLSDLGRAGTSRRSVSGPPEAATGPASLPDEECKSVRVLKPGTTIGRFIVLSWLGEGAMGIVYAAFDPDLDRKVALKLLRSEAFNPGEQLSEANERLFREAQAMARLSHPNVATIFEVGFFEERVFLASELIEGKTLAAWLREEPRNWREVLDAFSQAGRGLAAVHEAGLVHRDFKPANVLVRRDGRVVVTDFGLVRAARAEEPGATPAAQPGESGLRSPGTSAGASFEPFASHCTNTGFVLGTPAYMAPEQHLGMPADARTDQFAFCVCLYEALFGVRPFRGTSYEELAAAVIAGRVDDGTDRRRIPGWLQRGVLRGLRPDPRERFGSLQELLVTIDYRLRRRRRWRVASWVVPAAVAISALVGYQLGQPPGPPPCDDGSGRLGKLWGSDQQRSLQKAFAATGLPYAADSWNRVKSWLDRYSNDWLTLQRSNCRALQAAEPDQRSTYRARTLCLDERLRRFKALSNLFENADPGLVERAVNAARSLPNVQTCSNTDTRSFFAVEPDDPALRERVDDLRERLARVEALIIAGRYKDGPEAADALLTEVRSLPHPPIEAETLLALGILQHHNAQKEAAAKNLLDAACLADATGQDRVKARAFTGLAFVSSDLQMDFEQGHRWARQASAAIDRLGGDTEIQANLALGRPDQAVADLEPAEELTRELEGEASPGLAEIRYFLAQALWEQGRDRKRALRVARQAQATLEQLKGSQDLFQEVTAWLAAPSRSR